MPTRREGGLLQESLTRDVIGAFYEVHTELGFGFREYIYALALEQVLKTNGHRVDREVSVDVYFRGARLARQLMDMIVDQTLIVEIKATEILPASARQQLFGYLRATNLELGLLFHFGREAKFDRVICENRLKRRQLGSSDNR